MTLSRVRLGNLIEPVDERNSDNFFGETSLKGLSTSKILISSKADTTDLDLKGYKILRNNWFSYCTVTSRNGNRISIAYNDGDDCIISAINPVFKIKNTNILIPRYLMMFFNRPEFDRYARYNSWGSARETFTWEDFCEIEIDIPSIDVQKKYVAIYEGLLANLHSYEKRLDDLKLVCDGYIEDLFKKERRENLSGFLTRRMEKNTNFAVKELLGVGKEGFIKPKQGKDETNGHICYLVKKDDFVYAPPQIHQGSIDLYRHEKIVKCSDAYIVFYINNFCLNKEFLLAILKSPMFQKYAYYYRDGVREQLDFEQLCEFKVPVPSIETQNNIVQIYEQYNKSMHFINYLKDFTKYICPILIRGSLGIKDE